MKIKLQTGRRGGKSGSVLAVGTFEGEVRATFQALAKTRNFSAHSGESLFLPEKNTLLIGLGKSDKFRLQHVRLAAAQVLSQAKLLRLKNVAIDLDSLRHRVDLTEVAAAVVEGARLSTYRFDKYKSKKNPKPVLEELILLASQSSGLQKAISEAEIISEAVYFTRDVANEPPNVMTTVNLAKAAQKMARENNLTCRVLGLAEIKKLGMGGVLGVSQGSIYPPQFVILENKVTKRTASEPIVLVGKGVTFDTGGISIKPSSDMDKMKFDMCGAAAVMGAMKAIANLKLPVKVIGITPLVENMPGSKAQRPGDIIRCLNGKTVEVLNTDAEGRLILADALAYAKRFKPRALVDVATLTGACAATFHDLSNGLMSTDPDLAARIKAAGEASGERCWELPLWDEYFELIRATYADIQNISKKYAGTITAGMFLKEFADHTLSWAHLDIAGTAWNDGGAKPLSPIGATGVGVRLFINLVKSYL